MIIDNRRDEGVRIYHDIVPTIRAAWGTGGGNVPMVVQEDIKVYSMANCDHTLTLYGVNQSPTLTSRMGTGGNQVPVFVVNKNKANTLRANTGAIKHMADLKGRTVIEGVNYQGRKSASNTFKDICPALEANHGHDVHVVKQNSYCIARKTIGRKIRNSGNGAGFQKDISHMLNTIDRHAVTDREVYSIGHDERSSRMTLNIADTLTASDYIDPIKINVEVEPQISGTSAVAGGKGKNKHDINKFPVVESKIRRLTPTECERLQGLPDGWTDVPSIDKKGNIKPASDSSRYKAIGNGMAQPCADFVLRQIAYYARMSENEVE